MAADPHQRYEALALGHVLGGLEAREASTFRAHLVECRDCRRRVAELRDIADELAATEREERRRAAVATQVAEREEEEAGEEESTRRFGGVSSLVVGIVAVALVAGVFFWNYHLRRVAGEFAVTVDRQEDVLEVLAAGSDVSLETADGVEGRAAVHEGELAVSLDGVSELETNEFIAIWRLEGESAVAVQTGVSPGDGPLPFTLDVRDADSVVVTVQRRGDDPNEPTGHEIARVELSATSRTDFTPSS